MYQENTLLLLDEQIYSKKVNFVTKSIKMNLEIYEEFGRFCEEHYRHLKLQDLIAQSLLDFMKKKTGVIRKRVKSGSFFAFYIKSSLFDYQFLYKVLRPC